MISNYVDMIIGKINKSLEYFYQEIIIVIDISLNMLNYQRMACKMIRLTYYDTTNIIYHCIDPRVLKGLG